MVTIIIVLVLLGLIVWQIYPAISAPHTSDYMIEEDSPSYMENEEKPITELVIEKTPTNNDFVEKDYTVDSWKAFKEALDHAKDVLQNENTTQDEVDQALASLQDAIKNLKTVSQTGNNDQPNQKPISPGHIIPPMGF